MITATDRDEEITRLMEQGRIREAALVYVLALREQEGAIILAPQPSNVGALTKFTMNGVESSDISLSLSDS